VYKLELTLDAIKKRLIEFHNLTNSSSLLDKDFKICYNYDKQTITIERKEHGQASNKSGFFSGNAHRINETD